MIKYGWKGDTGRGGPDIDRSMTEAERERKLKEGKKRRPLPRDEGAYRSYIQKVRARRTEAKEESIAKRQAEQARLRKALKAASKRTTDGGSGILD